MMALGIIDRGQKLLIHTDDLERLPNESKCSV